MWILVHPCNLGRRGLVVETGAVLSMHTHRPEKQHRWQGNPGGWENSEAGWGEVFLILPAAFGGRDHKNPLHTHRPERCLRWKRA